MANCPFCERELTDFHLDTKTCECGAALKIVDGEVAYGEVPV